MHKARINTPGSSGYQVRMGRDPDTGRRRTKWFADGIHGGKEAAAEAAELFMARNTPRRKRARDHVPGVTLRWRQGRAESYVTAMIQKNGVTTSRSLDKHGPEEAIRQAVTLVGLKGDEAVTAVAILMRRFRRMMKGPEQ